MLTDLTDNPAFLEGTKEWVYDESKDPEWLVGKTLSVFWPRGKSRRKKQWYVGTIQSFDKKTGKHRIIYTIDGDERNTRFRNRTWSVVGLPGHHIKVDPCPKYVYVKKYPNIAGSLHAAQKQLSDTKLQTEAAADLEKTIGKKMSSAATMLGNEIMNSLKERAKKLDQKLEKIESEKKQLRKLLQRAGIVSNLQDEGLDSETVHVTVYCRGTPVRSARDLFYKSELCEVTIKAAEQNKENAFLDVNPSIMNDILDRLKYDIPHPMENRIYKKTYDYLCMKSKHKTLQQGERVRANYKGKGTFHNGYIRRVNRNGTFYVLFDNGYKEDNVEEDRISIIGVADRPRANSSSSEEDNIIR